MFLVKSAWWFDHLYFSKWLKSVEIPALWNVEVSSSEFIYEINFSVKSLKKLASYFHYWPMDLHQDPALPGYFYNNRWICSRRERSTNGRYPPRANSWFMTILECWPWLCVAVRRLCLQSLCCQTDVFLICQGVNFEVFSCGVLRHTLLLPNTFRSWHLQEKNETVSWFLWIRVVFLGQ